MSDTSDAELSVKLSALVSTWQPSGGDEHGGASDDPLAAVVTFHDVIRLAEGLQVQAARSAHEAGASWSKIGSTLGISRQAAQQRFDANYSVAPPPVARRRTLGPVSRDEEMDHLAAAGNQGWKLVEARHGEHSVEQRGGAWETKRVSIFTPRSLPSARDGWVAVSTRFPDCFYVREQAANLDDSVDAGE